MRTRSVLASAIALLIHTGCADREIGAIEVEPSRVERIELPSEIKDEIDLLFVIDNSVSMGEEHDSLALNFGRFIEILKNAEGGLPSLHIGVVTSDMGTMGGTRFFPPGDDGGECDGFGDGGALQMPPAVTTAKYLESLRPATPGGPRPGNHAGSLEEAFSAAATSVGSRGCNYESHLMSMKRALDGNPLNQGFLRPDAFLAVVFIADEDDCSVAEAGQGFFNQPDLLRNSSSFICFRNSTVCDGPADPFTLGARTNCRPREDSPFSAQVSSMVAFLKSVKSESELVVAGIYGQLENIEVQRQRGGSFDVAASCHYPESAPTQYARPPVRLDAFVRQFRNHVSTTICSGDLAGPMSQIARLVTKLPGTRCFLGKVAEPRYCSVADVTDPFGPDRHADTIPQCDAGHSEKPCWVLGEDLQACPTTETHLAIRIDRGSSLPPSNSRVVADCVTE